MTEQCFKFHFHPDTVTTIEFNFLSEDKMTVAVRGRGDIACICATIKDAYKDKFNDYLYFGGLTVDSVFDVIVALDESGDYKTGAKDIVGLPCPPFCSKDKLSEATSLCSGSAKKAAGFIKSFEKKIDDDIKGVMTKFEKSKSSEK